MHCSPLSRAFPASIGRSCGGRISPSRLQRRRLGDVSAMSRQEQGIGGQGWTGCAMDEDINLKISHQIIEANVGAMTLGLGDFTDQPSGLSCAVLGGPTPFIVRKSSDHYNLVGACYVHGLMNGEAVENLEERKRELKDF